MKNFLPLDFTNNMKLLLNDIDYNNFIDDYNKPYYKGIRINTLKTNSNDIKKLLKFDISPTPFCENSFYIPHDIDNLGKSPLHHCGAFYIQEPSATSAVTVLDVKPHDKVLDLCASPGGKSTQIASDLQSTGLLWANEIIKSRANILLSNIERMGVSNCIVSSCHPEELCSRLKGFFDKILVDAPCSGEGMFRKDKESIEQWSEEHTKMCGVRQLQILESASKALKTNGILVYSTCTFSSEENEKVITKFLNRNNDFELIESNVNFGRKALVKAIRILPSDGGEGHFIAKLYKKRNSSQYDEYNTYEDKSNNNKTMTKDEENIKNSALKLYDEISNNRFLGEDICISNSKIYILPKGIPKTKGLYILRAGILLGEIKKNRIEPCHSFFMAGSKNNFKNVVDLDYKDELIIKYLLGQEIEINTTVKGYTAVCVNGITTGFGKASNGVLKNKYPKGLRNLK